MQNKKAFTLIEVLIILLLLSILAITALTTYFNTTETFGYLSQFKYIMTTSRAARSYAITNRNSEEVYRYGLKISENQIILFGDLKDPNYTPYIYDDGEEIRVMDLNESNYSINGVNIGLDAPIYIFYETGSGDMSAYKQSAGGDYVLIPKYELKHLDFEFWSRNLQKYFVFFQVSGMAEEFDEL